MECGAETDDMAREELQRVARASRNVDEAREELFACIIAAHESGETLRDIAKAAGLSHQRIHQIAREKAQNQ